MTFATRLTKVRDCSEHFDERTRMCYHQAPPAERVVVHVRGAGQAKPHLEHNPLSLLGTCYATPRRKLNDPATPESSFVLFAALGGLAVSADGRVVCRAFRITAQPNVAAPHTYGGALDAQA